MSAAPLRSARHLQYDARNSAAVKLRKSVAMAYKGNAGEKNEGRGALNLRIASFAGLNQSAEETNSAPAADHGRRRGARGPPARALDRSARSDASRVGDPCLRLLEPAGLTLNKYRTCGVVHQRLTCQPPSSVGAGAAASEQICKRGGN
ncbi:hypothetical protein EVAR_11789_1 [Eumeta japonica]|uniref:Uncharacterized protein n=1 Tax=Eumeta variegata TaxID=151549 RepID=A0A4C1UQL1_EUMVA|nr:hypothetical protein EVAR_11789_1 [Eumeta japonica]